MTLGDVKFLLTDNFDAFSKNIQAIHAQKKEKALGLRELYEAHQKEMAALDEQADALYKEWKANLAKAESKKSESE